MTRSFCPSWPIFTATFSRPASSLWRSTTGRFSSITADRRFPVAPRSYDRILGHRLEELERDLGADDPALIEFQSILTADEKPSRQFGDRARKGRRTSAEKEVIKRRLAAVAAESAADPRVYRAQRGALQRHAWRPGQLRAHG